MIMNNKFIAVIILLLAVPGAPFAAGQGGGQTKDAVSGWTVDTLREHQKEMDDLRQKFMDERAMDTKKSNADAILSVKESAALALESAKEANRKNEVQSDKRFESVNEFRGQLKDQTATFVPRSEFLGSIASLTDKMESNTKLLVARIDLISNRVVESNAQATGSSQVWVVLGAVGLFVFSGIGALISIGGFIFLLVTRKKAAQRAAAG